MSQLEMTFTPREQGEQAAQACLGAAERRGFMSGMKTAQAIAHFKTQTALAKAVGLDQSTVSTWKEYPPPLRQLQIEALTGGELKAEADCDKFRVPVSARAA